jgi:DNA uptake protein ComE-like DNA-binding protein
MENILQKQRYCLTRSKARPEGGSALILVIWCVIIFSVLAVSLGGVASARLRASQVLRDRVMGFALARAACAHFAVERAQNLVSFVTIEALAKERSAEVAAGEFLYTAQDENGKIDLNAAPEEVLGALPGVDKVLAEKLVNSAFKPYHSKEEILSVEGLTPKILETLGPMITTYTKGEVNINTAPPAVLTALGFDEGLLQALQRFRTGADGIEGNTDDGVFKSTDEILPKLKQISALFQAQEALLLERISQGLLGVNSNVFDLNIEARFGGRTIGHYQVVTDGSNILKWNG